MKNNQQTDAKQDRLAKAIAAKIVHWKTKLAKGLNRRFNGYSSRKQKCLLALYFSTGIAALLFSLWLSFGQVPENTAMTRLPPTLSLLRHQPGGQGHAQITDSLIINQQANGKSTTGRGKSRTQ